MAPVSKLTATRLAFSSAVLSAIDVHGDAIASGARDSLFTKPHRGVDVPALFAAMRFELASAEDALREADAVHLAELSDDDLFRATRDEGDANLRASVANANALVTGAYGSMFAANVGLAVALERRGDLLITQARNAVRLMRSKRAPEAVISGIRVNLGAVADSVERAVETFHSSLSDVERERREAQQTLIARDEATERWDRVYTAVAELLVAFAAGAGNYELAERIRPTARRRAGLDEPVVDPADPQEPVTDGS